MKMAAEIEKIKVIKKAIDILKKELSPVEYVRFLEVITPKIGDAESLVTAKHSFSRPVYLGRPALRVK